MGQENVTLYETRCPDCLGLGVTEDQDQRRRAALRGHVLELRAGRPSKKLVPCYFCQGAGWRVTPYGKELLVFLSRHGFLQAEEVLDIVSACSSQTRESPRTCPGCVGKIGTMEVVSVEIFGTSQIQGEDGDGPGTPPDGVPPGVHGGEV